MKRNILTIAALSVMILATGTCTSGLWVWPPPTNPPTQPTPNSHLAG